MKRFLALLVAMAGCSGDGTGTPAPTDSGPGADAAAAFDAGNDETTIHWHGLRISDQMDGDRNYCSMQSNAR